MIDRDKELEEIVNSNKKMRTISNGIANANQLPVREYMDTVKYGRVNNNFEKRAIKGRKSIGKGKISRKLIAAILAGGIALGAGGAIVVDKVNEKIELNEEEKQKTYNDLLNTIKEEIAKNTGGKTVKVWNKSTITSSSGHKTHYVVNIDGVVYEYIKTISGDVSNPPRVDELSEGIKRAISVLTNGSVEEQKEVLEEIENGDIELTVSEKIKENDDMYR